MEQLRSHLLPLVAVAGLVFPIVASGQDTDGAGQWTALPVARTGHAYHAAVALNGKLYVVGGDRGMDFEVFDPVNPENNVARVYTDDHRKRIVAAAEAALDAIVEASCAVTKAQEVECWQVVLGNRFQG